MNNFYLSFVWWGQTHVLVYNGNVFIFKKSFMFKGFPQPLYTCPSPSQHSRDMPPSKSHSPTIKVLPTSDPGKATTTLFVLYTFLYVISHKWALILM